MFQDIMNAASLWMLPAILIIILTTGLIKKVPIYEVFTEGAKEGFKVSVSIIPYLVAIIVGISMFRASGIIEMTGNILSPFLAHFNIQQLLEYFQTSHILSDRKIMLQPLLLLW